MKASMKLLQHLSALIISGATGSTFSHARANPNWSQPDIAQSVFGRAYQNFRLVQAHNAPGGPMGGMMKGGESHYMETMIRGGGMATHPHHARLAGRKLTAGERGGNDQAEVHHFVHEKDGTYGYAADQGETKGGYSATKDAGQISHGKDDKMNALWAKEDGNY
jgi:hypothetical protein